MYIIVYIVYINKTHVPINILGDINVLLDKICIYVYTYIYLGLCIRYMT